MSDTPHQVDVHGTPEQIWAFLWDADALGRVLPGCESISALGQGVYQAKLAVKVPFFTVHGDVRAELHEPDPPRSVVLTLDGTTRGLNGSLRVRLPMALEAVESSEDPVTRIRYGVEVEVAGALTAFGPRPIRDALVGEVKGLAANIEREIRAGRIPGMTTP